jgi:hypothetical protein
MSCFALQAVTAREIVATGGTAAMHVETACKNSYRNWRRFDFTVHACM